MYSDKQDDHFFMIIMACGIPYALLNGRFWFHLEYMDVSGFT